MCMNRYYSYTHFSVCIRVVLHCFVVIYQIASCFVLVYALAGYHSSIPPGEVTAGCKLPRNWLVRLAVDLATFLTCVE